MVQRTQNKLVYIICVSPGSVTIRFCCDGIFSDSFIVNFPGTLPVKEKNRKFHWKMTKLSIEFGGPVFLRHSILIPLQSLVSCHSLPLLTALLRRNVASSTLSSLSLWPVRSTTSESYPPVGRWTESYPACWWTWRTRTVSGRRFTSASWL